MPDLVDADAIILTRRPDGRVYVLAVVMPIAALMPSFVAFDLLKSIVTPTGPITRIDYINAAVWNAVAGLFIWLAFSCIRLALTKAVFRNQSAQLLTLGRVRRSVRYAECERFMYRRQRHYKYGVWVGTYFKVKLAAKGKPTVAISGRHKERATLAGATFLSKEFVGTDEIDILPAHVGTAIADAWEARLAAGEHIRWVFGYTLTNEGIIPRYGPHKGQCIAYDRVELVARSMESFDLRIAGDRNATRLTSASANFWPGAIVIERLSGTTLD